MDRSNAKDRKEWLEKRLKQMREYLLLKYDEEDYHGIADAAMDIREIVAEIRCLDRLGPYIANLIGQIKKENSNGTKKD